MEPHRVLITGDMLFAETLARLLSPNSEIEVVGIAPDLESARKFLEDCCPDALIYVSQSEDRDEPINQFLHDNSDLSIICTEHDQNTIRVIVSQRISVHSSGDLMAAIINLPKRSRTRRRQADGKNFTP